MASPLEYVDALLAPNAGPSHCGVRAAMSELRLRPSDTLDIFAFGGSVTLGSQWQGVQDGNVYPRVLATDLVHRNIVQSVRVHNLAIGATHGAASHALCCETLLSPSGLDATRSIAWQHEGPADARQRPWLVNRTFRGEVRALPDFGQHALILLEFSNNGVSWLDVLLRRLRERYASAVLIYVDLTSLYAWREGKYPKFVWNSLWETAPACTAQLDKWLRSAGADFWSLRGSLLKSNASYYHAADRVFHGDKLHLKQVGHTLVGRELGGLVAARLRAEEHRAESSGPRRSLPLQARDDASSSGELCFLWYRSGELDKRLAASSDGAPIATRHVNRQAQGKSEGWRLLPSAQAGSSLHSKENGKYAFVLESAHNATPLGAATATAALEFRFNVTSPRSSLVIAHMLDGQIYGAAQAELDGAPFGPLLYGSSPNFPYHLLTTQRLGTVEGVGEHHLVLRLVRAAPTGAQRFRVGGLFVVAENGGGGGYETEYRWTVPHDR